MTPSAGDRPLWRCPRCGHEFVTKNMWHSCVRVKLSDHFTGKPPVLRETWNEWLAAARACGKVTTYAQKTRIVIQARVRFAGAVVRSSYIDAGLWLERRIEHPRLRRVEDFGSPLTSFTLDVVPFVNGLGPRMLIPLNEYPR